MDPENPENPENPEIGRRDPENPENPENSSLFLAKTLNFVILIAVLAIWEHEISEFSPTMVETVGKVSVGPISQSVT